MISMRRCAVLMVLLFALPAAAIDTTVLPNAELQARYEALTHELRCMQCQNNSIADSPVFLAADLRKQVAEQLIAGKSDDEIRDYMVQRYGDVILFKPPLNSSTAWVWFAPLVALVGGVIVAVVIVRRRSQLVATDDSVVDGDERL
jgi:cytochrome c-type biogenesis protein CcmH